MNKELVNILNNDMDRTTMMIRFENYYPDFAKYNTQIIKYTTDSKD